MTEGDLHAAYRMILRGGGKEKVKARLVRFDRAGRGMSSRRVDKILRLLRGKGLICYCARRGWRPTQKAA